MGTSLNSTQRKIHHLLSSGAVTVTGPNQPRTLKTKTVGNSIITNSSPQQNILAGQHCFVCDEIIGAHQVQHQLVEMQTAHTTTKFPKKIGQLVGDCFMIIVSVDDVICARCTNLINYYDRLENDIERVRTNLVGLINKKYGLSDEGGGLMTPSPPLKMQKLNSGLVNRTTTEENDIARIRKVVPPQLPTVSTTTPEAAIQKPAVSAVQQLKIPQTQPVIGSSPSTPGTQRKITKIYKCLCCEYKTSDMRLFNTHYETCKQQNFQCKNCKKIYCNFGLMKQHMIREHNTPMENTCSVCHINLVNDISLRKHMETNHATSVVVTSTTTIPTSSLAAADPGVVEQQLNVNASGAIVPPMNTSLYSCNQCQFKSTDKVIFDEHLRKHFGKPKPFKCRLCSQRFETKEGATTHLKQHQQPTQASYFKCSTCFLSFPKREVLNKHMEVVHGSQNLQQQHDNVSTQLQITAQTPHGKQHQQQQQQHHNQGQNLLTTQKLLQDTINEALSENIGSTNVSNDVADNNIRFFTCQNCSLTFVNENYYNQHMETHRGRDKKDIGNASTPITTSASSIRRNSGLNQVGGLMNENLTTVASTKENNMNAAAQANNGQGMTEVDIESIFEKMHSDKGDSNPDVNKSQVVNNAGVSIDMPMLDHPEEVIKSENSVHDNQSSDGKVKSAGPPVSMPSLDDDGDAAVLQQQQQQQLQHQHQQQQQQQESVRKTDSPHTNNGDSSNKEIKMEELKEENNANKENLDAHQQQTQLSNEQAAAAALLEQHQQTPHPHHIAEANQAAALAEQHHQAAVNAAGGGEGVKSEGADQLATVAAAAEAVASAEQAEAAANAAGATEGQVAIELDEAMQAQVDSGQIKLIWNENGQLLQLDNHILTDSEGNQILVQDAEQIQQLLQSVGVIQTGDGIDSDTLQVVTDGNGQMVLVQSENNEAQLIDASLLNAEGQLVIQQGQDGELGEGAHVIGEDGTRIPVSVSYTADGQPIVQVQHQVLEAAAAEGQRIVIESKEGVEANVNAGSESTVDGVPQTGEGSAAVTTTVTTATAAATTISNSGEFFSLEQLIQTQQQPQQQQASETKTAE